MEDHPRGSTGNPGAAFVGLARLYSVSRHARLTVLDNGAQAGPVVFGDDNPDSLLGWEVAVVLGTTTAALAARSIVFNLTMQFPQTSGNGQVNAGLECTFGARFAVPAPQFSLAFRDIGTGGGGAQSSSVDIYSWPVCPFGGPVGRRTLISASPLQAIAAAASFDYLAPAGATHYQLCVATVPQAAYVVEERFGAGGAGTVWQTYVVAPGPPVATAQVLTQGQPLLGWRPLPPGGASKFVRVTTIAGGGLTAGVRFRHDLSWNS